MKIHAVIWQDYDETAFGFLDSVDVTSTVTFGTQLHGGFAGASFVVPGAQDKTFLRYRLYLAGHVVLYDFYGRRIYEGEITDVKPSKVGLKVTAAGYFMKGANIFFDMVYNSYAATTNYCKNPSFEVNVTDSWSTSGGGSVARITTDYKIGGASAEMTPPGSGTLTYYFTVSVSAETDYTYSIYLKDNSLQGPVTMLIDEDNGGGVTETHTKTIQNVPDTHWARYAISITTNADTTSVVCKVRIESGGGKLRVDASQYEPLGYASTYCDGSLGAYHSWTGTAHNSSSLREGWSSTAYAILKDVVDLIPEWRDGAYSHMKATDIMVGAQDFTDRKGKEAVEAMMGYGYKEDELRAMYFAIWNHRIPFVIPEPTSTQYPNWFVSAMNVVEGDPVGMSTRDVFNKVYAIYSTSEAGSSKTVAAEDAISQGKYGTREGLVQNSSTAEGLAMGEDMRDMALEHYKYPRQTYQLRVKGLIKSGIGGYEYPYIIRAGEMIVLTDLDAFSSEGGTLYGIAGRSSYGFVLRTKYTASSNMTVIDIGSVDHRFDISMARLGLSGGLS